MIRNACLLLASLVFSLLLVEGMFRVLGNWSTDSMAERDFYAPSRRPDVPYLLQPGLVGSWGLGTVRAGPLGLRDERPLPPRRDGDLELRVLVVGDSLVEGIGVDQEETLPRRLEARLRDRLRAVGDPRDVRVVNAGIAGFNATNEAALLEILLPEIRPDLVVWTLIANDYEDALRSTASGILDSSATYRMVLVSNLWHVWGVTGGLDLEDARRSMRDRQLRWANGTSGPPTLRERSERWLRRRSHLFGLASHRWHGRVRAEAATKTPNRNRLPLQPEIAVYGREVGGSGSPRNRSGVERAPLFSAVFESPRFRQRFDAAIERGELALERADVPAVVYGFGVPGWFRRTMESAASVAGRGDRRSADAALGSVSRRLVEFRDGMSLLGTSFGSFRGRYSLGWDGHLGPGGLDFLARAIEADLVRLRRIPGTTSGADVGGDASRLRDRARLYWRGVEAARDRFRESFGPVLELADYRGIHQLIGGIPPPRTFPWLESARFAVLLRGAGQRRLFLEVERLEPLDSRFEVRVGAGDRVWRTRTTLAGETSRWEISLPPAAWPEGVHDFLDVEVRCVDSPCPKMRIDRIGLESRDALQDATSGR